MTASSTPSEVPKQQKEADGQLDSSEQQALDDPIKQEQDRQEYLGQLPLRSCPGCRETDLF